MFKKKPQIKTLSPLRSSDRRKLADKIIADYGLHASPSSTSPPDQTQEQTQSHTELRRSLLPDNVLSAKFATTSGPDLKEVVGTVYVGSHGAAEQRVLWVKFHDTIYPSVYSLWHNARILPLLHTPRLVIDKLKGGADLMTPGLAGPPFPPAARKGTLVAIACLDSPSVPLVVGTCLVDVSALQKTQGEKGHAVETFHCAGDELWDWSTSGRSGTSPPDQLPQWLAAGHDDLSKATETSLKLSDDADEDGGVSLEPDAGGGHVTSGATTKTNGAHEPGDHTSADSKDDGLAEVVDVAASMTPKEIDDAFWKAFLYGVYQQKQSHRTEPKYGLDFPLNQSVFMATLVQPYLPIHSAGHAQALQMKKTSWKNIRKFIKALDKAKLMLSKEGKTESMVLDIDFDDTQFVEFRPYRLPDKQSAGSTSSAGPSGASGDALDEAVGQTIKVLNFYRPSESLLPLFSAPNSPRQSYYTAADVRAAVTEYIQASDLVVPTNKRQVKLDPIVSNAVLSESSKIDRELLAKGAMPRDALIDRVVSQCALSHAILRNDESMDTGKTKPKAGAAPKVGILLETRGGNKTVTRVFGLEPYHVKAQALADELRKTCASSTSVEPFKGGKGLEVMVQGPQADAVTKALARRGIAKGWIEVTDKTKGKKK